MKTFYADDTYGKPSPEAPVPRFHLFGGIIVDRDTEVSIIERMRCIKGKYTHPNLPVKWNFKDNKVKETYKRYRRESEYKLMLNCSNEWRKAIFQEIDDLPYSILVSCIESFSNNRDEIVKLKNDLNTYCFEMVLMRVGIDAKADPNIWHCVLDWPPDKDPTPFNRGYYNLFHYGKTSANVVSHCGPLEKVGFSHSLVFTSCNHSPMLQLVDLAIGAIRDHIECQSQGRKSSVGTEVVNVFYNHFRNLDGVVPRYGVTAATGNEALAEKIASIFAKKVSHR